MARINCYRSGCIALFAAFLAGCATPLPIHETYEYSETELRTLVDQHKFNWPPKYDHPTGHWLRSNTLEITLLANACGRQYVQDDSMSANVSEDLIQLQYRFSNKAGDTTELCCSPIKLTYRIQGLARQEYHVQVTTHYSETYQETTDISALPVD